MPSVTLRPVSESDLPVFYEHMQHKPSQRMAAFVHEDPSDRGAFDAHWAKLLALPTCLNLSIELDGQLAGHISSFDMPGDEGLEREITYWVGHEHWGRGVASAALASFLNIERTRPLYGRAAKDNVASIRVMQRCGFTLLREERGFANARGEEIDEVVMVLR